MNEPEFLTYRARLKREGILKSLLWGLALGALTAVIVGLATWISDFKGLFLTIGLFAGVTVVATIVVYFLFFKPYDKGVARRVDNLGLDERLITMLELEGDDSYIAQKQREDAKQSLNNLGVTKLKFSVSLLLILLLSIGGAFAIAMTTITGLADYGIIPTGMQIYINNKEKDPDNYVDVSYVATNGGEIFGDAEQRVMIGGGTTKVMAVALEGYRFYQWTDGYPYPARADINISDPTTFTARFVAMDKEEQLEEGDSDEPSDIPPEDGNAAWADPNQKPDAGGEYKEYNYVIDGKTVYRGVFDDYYQAAMDELMQDTEMSAEMRAFIEAYFNSIKN